MRAPLASVCLMIAVTSGACAATVYAPGQSAGFVLDPDYEVTDKDIRQAFKARPQLRGPLRVAFFSLDPRKVKAIKEALGKVAGVESVYAIPPLLVTGQRRFATRHHHGRPSARRPPSVKKMRLLAARARCNLLLIFDHEYRVQRRINWVVAFSVLLLPNLFLPHMDAEVESHLATYMMDVGNGYLYGQIDDTTRRSKRYTTVFSTWHRKAARGNFRQLLTATLGKLTGLLKRYQTPPATARR